jgi:hypothetical protein
MVSPWLCVCVCVFPYTWVRVCVYWHRNEGLQISFVIIIFPLKWFGFLKQQINNFITGWWIAFCMYVWCVCVLMGVGIDLYKQISFIRMTVLLEIQVEGLESVTAHTVFPHVGQSPYKTGPTRLTGESWCHISECSAWSQLYRQLQILIH